MIGQIFWSIYAASLLGFIGGIIATQFWGPPPVGVVVTFGLSAAGASCMAVLRRRHK